MAKVEIQDSAGNWYRIPEEFVEDFKLQDEAITDTYDDVMFGVSDRHIELCDRWEEIWGVYEISAP